MTNPTDPYDTLASMFLTDDRSEPSPKTPDRDRTAAPVEALIVGHLPVRASLWLTPYAATRARAAGTTAMVRLDGDEPMVQVHRGLDDQPPASACRSLRETILQIGNDAKLWLVRPSLQTHPEDLLATRPDRVTILSSSDQVAVVHAYRVVKELWEAAQHLDCDMPEVGLAILGSDASAADSVVERVNRTTEEQLGLAVRLHLCMPAMDATVRASCLRSFPGLGRPALRDVRAWIREAATPREREAVEEAVQATAEHEQAAAVEESVAQAQRAQDQAAEQRERVAERTAHHQIETPAREINAEPTVAMRPTVDAMGPEPSSFSREEEGPASRKRRVVEVEAPERSASPAEEAAEDEPVEAIEPPTPLADFIAGVGMETGQGKQRSDDDGETEQVKLSPKPGAEAREQRETQRNEADGRSPREDSPHGAEAFESKPMTDQPAEPSKNGEPIPLAEHVPGLRPMPARCPDHAHVELAADEDGNLHLLAKPHDLRNLMTVETWATAHRDLLAMACPNVGLAARPIVHYHVFTSDPLSVADLHRSKVSLHLLAPVTVEGRQGWFATALNKPAKR